jgi:hypothetical protein
MSDLPLKPVCFECVFTERYKTMYVTAIVNQMEPAILSADVEFVNGVKGARLADSKAVERSSCTLT